MGWPDEWAKVRGQVAEGLAQIDCIGEHAEALKSNGIEDERALFDNAKGRAQRLALAEAVGVSPLLVERWARLCEIEWRLELSRDQLNMLDRANAGSIGVLQQVEAGALHALLESANEAYAADVPSEDTLAEWIEEAKGPEQVVPELA